MPSRSGILAALHFAFLTLRGALDAAMFLILLLLSAQLFSEAFFSMFRFVENHQSVSSQLVGRKDLTDYRPCGHNPKPAAPSLTNKKAGRNPPFVFYHRLRPRPMPLPRPPRFPLPPKLDSRGLASLTLMLRPLSSVSLKR